MASAALRRLMAEYKQVIVNSRIIGTSKESILSVEKFPANLFADLKNCSF